MNNISNTIENSLDVSNSITSEIDMLNQIHNDLGIITSFIILVVVFALFYVIYKAMYNFFNI